MKRVRIIGGVYAYADGGKRRTAGRGTVLSLPDEEAERLAFLGVAVSLGTDEREKKEESAAQRTGKKRGAHENTADAEQPPISAAAPRS